MEHNSWELTDFNVDGHLILSSRFGQVKIMRSDDGLLTLIENSEYGRLDQTQPTRSSFFKPDSALGFILDIGIRKEKMLARETGFYFGSKMINAQSNKKVSQADFDLVLFEKIGDLIQTYFQSSDSSKEIEAIKLQFILDEYNNARLLYPNFYAESYLNLMRIIDALSDESRGAYDFANFAAQISPAINKEIFDKLGALGGYGVRIDKAIELFDTRLTEATAKNFPCVSVMTGLDKPARVVWSCFYSAYQYRNEFTHRGFPFPRVVKEIVGSEEDSGTAYLSPVWGMSWSRFYRPGVGLQEGDSIDIHEVVGDEAILFKETYFLLIPTWHFLRRLTKEAILNKITSLPV